jgi:hypothetical protein
LFNFQLHLPILVEHRGGHDASLREGIICIKQRVRVRDVVGEELRFDERGWFSRWLVQAWELFSASDVPALAAPAARAVAKLNANIAALGFGMIKSPYPR